ncbi:MAG: InlB B-repeat-containing protein, partial [Muribaculaceae bacterium]|nr:InlB B-repeat-containing protein [Muribaculaceae bacterium]
EIDGEIIEEKVVEYGSEITAPEAPEIEGYTFEGWDDLPATMPAKDLVVTGDYTVNYYTLTITIDDTVVEEKEVAYGSDIVTPETPDKEGHKFQGWFNYVPTMPAADLTIYGSYLKNTHLLTFEIDGQIIEEKVVEYGSEITAPEAPEKEGYTFDGWGDVPATMPAKDLVVSGSYTINSYKLTLYLNDEVYFEETLEYGAEINVPEVDVPAHMKFEGWDEEIPAVMPAHDVTIYGKMVEDGSSAVDFLFDADDTVTIYNLNGVMLYKNVKVNEIKERLTPGLYVINGKKVIIR